MGYFSHVGRCLCTSRACGHRTHWPKLIPSVPGAPVPRTLRPRRGSGGASSPGLRGWYSAYLVDDHLVPSHTNPLPSLPLTARAGFHGAASSIPLGNLFFFFFCSPIDIIRGFYGNVWGGKGRDAFSKAGVIPGTPRVWLCAPDTHDGTVPCPITYSGSCLIW